MINCSENNRRIRKTWNFKPQKKKIKEMSIDENNNKQQSAPIPNKTPAAILFELLSKEGKSPVYEIVAEKPTIPSFTCRVSCGEQFGELCNEKE
jgi:hypothetical protein